MEYRRMIYEADRKTKATKVVTDIPLLTAREKISELLNDDSYMAITEIEGKIFIEREVPLTAEQEAAVQALL